MTDKIMRPFGSITYSGKTSAMSNPFKSAQNPFARDTYKDFMAELEEILANQKK